MFLKIYNHFFKKKACMTPISSPQSRTEQVAAFIGKWGPRAIAVAVGGYYGLGIAYDLGFMALIDQVAIQVIKNVLGYAGIGALMPTLQWYSAWAARILCGVVVGVAYDLLEKGVKSCWNQYCGNRPVRVS
jgi:hypothetical protein